MDYDGLPCSLSLPNALSSYCIEPIETPLDSAAQKLHILTFLTTQEAAGPTASPFNTRKKKKKKHQKVLPR